MKSVIFCVGRVMKIDKNVKALQVGDKVSG